MVPMNTTTCNSTHQLALEQLQTYAMHNASDITTVCLQGLHTMQHTAQGLQL
jgi:hypothetical protein